MQNFSNLSKFLITSNLTIVSLFCLILVSCEDKTNDNTTIVSALALVTNATSGTTSNTSEGTCSTTGPCKMFVPAANPALNTNLGISGVDAYCNNATDKPSGGGTYKAFVADGTNRIACTSASCSGGPSEHTDWVLKANKEYRQSNGTTVIGTTTANGIFTFPLTNEPQTTINSTNMTATGLNQNWTSSSDDCTNWSGTGSFAMGSHTVKTVSTINSGGTGGCASTTKILCVEQ